jgi:hypothetical protein
MRALAGGEGVVNPESPVSRSSFNRLVGITSPVAVPAPARRWSEEDWGRIREGHSSFDMDDKWDAFVERDRLFLHRSWTGLGVYEALFARSEGHWGIVEAVVENDPTSHRRCSDEIERLCLELIVESVLLGRFRQHDWQRWQAMVAGELSAARIPPGRLYAREQEVLQGPDGQFLDLQQLREFDFAVWLHMCIGNWWGQPVSSETDAPLPPID